CCCARSAGRSRSSPPPRPWRCATGLCRCASARLRLDHLPAMSCSGTRASSSPSRPPPWRAPRNAHRRPRGRRDRRRCPCRRWSRRTSSPPAGRAPQTCRLPPGPPGRKYLRPKFSKSSFDLRLEWFLGELGWDGDSTPNAFSLASAQLVAHDQAAFHHEPDALHFGDVLERVSGAGDDVRELAFFDRPYVVFPAVVQHARGRKKRRLQGLRRGHAPFHEVSELVGLPAVGDGRGCGAASEHDGDTGGERALESLLHELE